MLAVRAIYRQGQLEWIGAPPAGAEGMVAVLFLDAGVATDEEMQEAKIHCVTELRGLGKEVWQGTDAQQYVDDLRTEWDRSV